MSQYDLADYLDERLDSHWDASKVSKVENGRRRVEVDLLLALRDIFGLPLEWWVDGPEAVRDRNLAMPPLLKSGPQEAAA